LFATVYGGDGQIIDQDTLEVVPEAPPVVSVSAVTNITTSTAHANGAVTDEGSSPVVMRGFCWRLDTLAVPSVFDPSIASGSGEGAFGAGLTNLLPDTTYYLRAFAINGSDTGYSSRVSFRTEPVSDTVAMLINHGPWNAFFWGESENGSNKLGVMQYVRNVPSCPDLITNNYKTDNIIVAFKADYTGTYAELEYDLYWNVNLSNCTLSGPSLKNYWFTLNHKWEYFPATKSIKAKSLNDDGTTGDYLFEFRIKSISPTELTGDYYGIEKGETYYAGFLKLH